MTGRKAEWPIQFAHGITAGMSFTDGSEPYAVHFTFVLTRDTNRRLNLNLTPGEALLLAERIVRAAANAERYNDLWRKRYHEESAPQSIYDADDYRNEGGDEE